MTSAAARGYDAEWQALRLQHLKVYPKCIIAGCGRLATVVDHVVSIADAPHRRLDPTNLRSMCKPCHDRRTSMDQIHHNREERELGGCDETGWPTSPNHPWNRGSWGGQEP